MRKKRPSPSLRVRQGIQPKLLSTQEPTAVDAGADISSMIGTVAISLVLLVIALVLAAIEHHKKVPIQKISGGGSDSLRRQRRNPICAGTPAGRTAALLAHAKLAP